MAGRIVDGLPGIYGVARGVCAVKEPVPAHRLPPGVHDLVVLQVPRQRQPQQVGELQQQGQLLLGVELGLYRQPTWSAAYKLPNQATCQASVQLLYKQQGQLLLGVEFRLFRQPI